MLNSYRILFGARKTFSNLRYAVVTANFVPVRNASSLLLWSKCLLRMIVRNRGRCERTVSILEELYLATV